MLAYEKKIKVCLIIFTYLQNRNRFTDLENQFMVTGGKVGRKDRVEVWDWHAHSSILKINSQQEPAA